MSKLKKVTLICDLCHSTDDVETLVLTREGSKSIEIDICQECWEKDMIVIPRGKAQPATKTAGRPQVRFTVTDLPPQP